MMSASERAWPRTASQEAWRRFDGLGRAASLALFAEIPVIVLAFVAWSALGRHFVALADFSIFRDAGRDILEGRSPYVAPVPEQLIGDDKFVYPPLVGFLFIPFALISLGAGRAVFTLLFLVSVPLTLRLLGVRDWRCYGLAFLLAPVLTVFGAGAIGSLLALGVAAAWRHRSKTLVAALVIALVVVAKLFLWPLLVWLLATRRYRALVATVAIGACLLLGSWAAIGFSGLREYPQLLTTVADVSEWRSYSLGALGLAVGVPTTAVHVAGAMLALLVVPLLVALGHRPDGDRRAFCACIGSALLISPIVWLHYLVLLVVPIAVARPRLAPLWLVPLVLWSTPGVRSDGDPWRIFVALAVTSLVLAASIGRAGPPLRERWETP